MEFFLFVFALTVIIYFLPSFIASGRRHSATFLIFLLNFTLGWTGIVWLICLIWAVLEPDSRQAPTS